MNLFSIKKLSLVMLVVCALTHISKSVFAGDWPQWRGTKRDGIAHGEKLPSPLPAKLNRVWRVKVGEGYSAPAIVGDRIYLMTRRGDDEYFICLNAADGAEVWSHHYASPFKAPDFAAGAGNGPKATVAVDGGQVFGMGINEVLTCLDAATGKVQWTRDFGKEFGKPFPSVGVSASPLIVGDLCITQTGEETNGGIAAYDRKTGKDVWRSPGDGPAFSSCELFEFGGTPQVVALTRESIASADLKSGAKLWSVPFKTQYFQNIVVPVLAGDLLFCTGIQAPSLALRIEKKEDKFNPVTVWSTNDHSSYMNSPIAYQGHIYMLSGKRKGTYVCMDAKDGKTLWNSSTQFGDYASAVLVEDKLLILTAEGQIKVVPATPAGYKEVMIWDVAESSTWAHLALANGRLYVKDLDSLACIRWD